jgi:ABC transporter substrate binding protein
VGSYWTSIEEATRALAIQAISIPYSNAADIERAIDAFAAVPNGSLIIEATGFVGDNHQLFLGLAKKYRLPAIYPNRNYVADGGLMSYSSNQDESVRRLSSHVDRILRGAKPGDLPVEYPTRCDLVINLKAAEAIAAARTMTTTWWAYRVVTRISALRHHRAHSPDSRGQAIVLAREAGGKNRQSRVSCNRGRQVRCRAMPPPARGRIDGPGDPSPG